MDADILDIVAQRGGRARSACDLCRHKKIRCDGEKPACENCHFAGVTCTFTVTGQPRKTIREQLAEAKARVQELESFIAGRPLPGAVSPIIQLQDELRSASPYPPMSLFAAPSHPQDSSDFDIAMEIFKQHLEISWPGTTNSPQRNSFHATVYRQTGAVLDLHGFLARVTESYKAQYASISPAISTPQWPSYALIQKCLDYYSAKSMYSMFPVVDVPASQAVLDALVSGRTDPPPTTAEKAHLFAFAAFITKQHQHQPQFAGTDPDAYVQAVLTLVPKLMLELASALHIAPAGYPQQAQLLLSTAIRILYQLGGHRITPPPEYQPQASSTTTNNTESHSHLRAIFWLCYGMDKEMCIRSCSPPLIHDIDVDLDFPKTYIGSTTHSPPPPRQSPSSSTSSYTSNEVPLLYPTDIRLAIFKSHIYNRLYSSHAQSLPEARRLAHIRQLDQDLSELYAEFPLGHTPVHTPRSETSTPDNRDPTITPSSSLSSNEESSNHKLVNIRPISIHLEYHYCIRKLHEASITTSLSVVSAPLASSLELYYQASRSTLLYYLNSGKGGLVDRFSFW
ncbi:Zn(II)2Cys6 transcription factor [Aspergillus neoniger CBS 115656]|uniref:C6 transcription factor n=1 Tax=Aspergillus neoniger (strain CBS 115656) TaxID=1448310 RepID=A0A318YYB8_ASPNB|nr:C6 transcription factor [Aspergillus neoniger CBS 115656]PYH39991.1 C6 transcription factor [Aspergillus neoniger CBS 115656]